jgi:hypothetical protein
VASVPTFGGTADQYNQARIDRISLGKQTALALGTILLIAVHSETAPVPTLRSRGTIENQGFFWSSTCHARCLSRKALSHAIQ